MKVFKTSVSVGGLSCLLMLPMAGYAQDWNTVTTGDYGIRNITNSNTIPFTVEVGAPADSYYLDSAGNLGLGDAPPSGTYNPRLYVADQTPEISMDDIDDNQVWQIFSNGGDVNDPDFPLGGIGFADITAQSAPFYIENTAPPSSFLIRATGYIGMNTSFPEVNLHIIGDSVEPGSSPDPVEELLRLESKVAPVQTFVNQTSGAKWFFAMVSNDDFKVSFDGTGKVEARFKPNGDLRIGGALYQNSDRNRKQNISKIDAKEVLHSLVNLPISTWEYTDGEGVRHLGPMAQDFHAAFGIGLSPTTISSIDTGGVALAAIQGLKQEKDKQIEELKTEAYNMKLKNEKLHLQLLQQEERVMQLEMTLAEVMRKQSQAIQVGSVD